MLRVYFAAIAIVTGIYAQEYLIGPTPANQPILIGTDHILTCQRGPDGQTEGSVVFQDATVAPAFNVFFNGEKESNDATTPKYRNFASDPDNPFDILITSISVENEGTYVCVNAFYSLGISVTRTVEVPLTSFDLTQDGSPTTSVTVQEGVPSAIVCTAIGARPVVTIDWYHKTVQGSETKITDGVIQVDNTNVDNSDTTDSVSTLNYTATKDYDGGSLRCKTTGQEVAESGEDTASLIVQYIPVVNVVYGGDIVTCTHEANPAVTKVTIIVNGTEDYSSTCEDTTCTLLLKVDYDTDVRCNATNTIGTGTATTVAVPGAPPPTTQPPTVKGTTKKPGAPPPTTQPPTVKGTTKKPDAGELSASPINVGAIVGPVVAVFVGIAVVIFAVWFIKKKKSATKDEKKQSSIPHVSQANMELDQQTSQYESTYEVPETRDQTTADTAQAYMDLDPHTRDDNTTYQDLIANDKSQQGAGNSAYEVLDTKDQATADCAQAYMDLNPHTRDVNTAYQDLNPNDKPQLGGGNSAYEEIRETKDTPAYVNVQHTKPGQTKRK